MSVRREAVEITGPAGTAVSPRPVSGIIREVRINSTNLNTAPAGSADLTITRQDGGGTILALTDATFPAQYAPTQIAHSSTGGTIAGAPQTVSPVPCDGHIQVVLAQGGTATDTVHVFYEA